ncbi:MAG: rhomboid family intramembrane serine protease [Defluviitaleaceae bacterium]|nr:rhomboid family intramembrane serine protease [Defluviitaleaceae bacterium]
MQKMEGAATFMHITVCDTARADWQALLQQNEIRRKQAEDLLTRVKNVALVYIMAEPAPALDIAAVPAEITAPYEGQNIYNVFWRVNLATGELMATDNQPKDLFGLRELVKRAYEDASAPEADFDALAAAESLLGGGSGTSAPQGRSLPPAHSRPNVVPMRRAMPAPARKRSPHSLITRMKNVNIPHYPRHAQPLMCYGIIAINVLVLIAMYVFGDGSTARTGIDFGGIRVYEIIFHNEWWRLVTAMFIHFGVHHLAANTFGIIVFGTRLERYFGRLAFFALYFGAGIVGSLFSLANFWFQRLPTVSGGASGAVYGLVAFAFVVTRVTRQNIETLNSYSMLIFIAIGIVMGFTIPGIDNAGHIGGMVGGALIGLGTLALMTRKQ